MLVKSDSEVGRELMNLSARQGPIIWRGSRNFCAIYRQLRGELRTLEMGHANGAFLTKISKSDAYKLGGWIIKAFDAQRRF